MQESVGRIIFHADDQWISEIQSDLPNGSFIERRSSSPKNLLKPSFSEPVTLIAAVTVAWAIRYILRRVLPSGEMILVDMSGEEITFFKESTRGQSKVIVKKPDGDVEILIDKVDSEEKILNQISEILKASANG